MLQVKVLCRKLLALDGFFTRAGVVCEVTTLRFGDYAVEGVVLVTEALPLVQMAWKILQVLGVASVLSSTTIPRAEPLAATSK